MSPLRENDFLLPPSSVIFGTAGAVVDACRDTVLSLVVGGVWDLGGVVPGVGCTGDLGLGASMKEDLYRRDPLSPAMMDSLRCSMVASVYTSWKACCRIVHTSSASAWEGNKWMFISHNGTWP